MVNLVIDQALGFRVDEKHEISGIDPVLHAEDAYDLHSSAGAGSTSAGFLNPKEGGQES